jgi:hypothetical protein
MLEISNANGYAFRNALELIQATKGLVVQSNNLVGQP